MSFRILQTALLATAAAGILAAQTGSPLVYQVIQGSTTTITPGGTITFNPTGVGQTATLTVRVSNTGLMSSTINSITVSGLAFQLSNSSALPQTLAPNGSLAFTVIFSPAQLTTYNGTLTVNSDTFNLTGAGAGSRLAFSYFVNDTRIPLDSSNTSIIFSPVMISSSSQLSFNIRNTGTTPAIISNIGVGQTNSPYSVSGVPGLPLTILPNTEISLAIIFAPTALGFANGTLVVDSASIGLVGSGTQPPPLPMPTISGPSGSVAPMSQPRIGVTLANPYPVAVSGTLTLAVTGDLPADPAVQFSTGGRTVAFVIPANSTEAVFGSQGTRLGLQTGTVASTITLAASFLTQTGNVDLTPSTPPSLQFTVAPAVPQLLSVQITNQTANSFSVSITGFTTPRSLTAWNLQFTPSAGVSLASSQFKINIQQIASVWYRSASSQAFGSLFTMSVPLSFSGTASEGRSLVNSIASVAVTVENEQGASNSLSAPIQ